MKWSKCLEKQIATLRQAEIGIPMELLLMVDYGNRYSPVHRGKVPEGSRDSAPGPGTSVCG